MRLFFNSSATDLGSHITSSFAVFPDVQTMAWLLWVFFTTAAMCIIHYYCYGYSSRLLLLMGILHDCCYVYYSRLKKHLLWWTLWASFHPVMTVGNIISRSEIPTLRLRLQYFRVSRQWHGCQHLGFLTCAHMLMHVTAHGGCTNSVRESALKANCWRKALCRTGQWNQSSQRAGPVAHSTD